MVVVTTSPSSGPSSGPPNAIADVLSVLGYVLAAFAAGGLVGGTAVSVVAGRLLKNKDALDALERVAVSTIPISALPVINELARNIATAAKLLDKVTDQQPNVPDPVDPSLALQPPVPPSTGGPAPGT